MSLSRRSLGGCSVFASGGSIHRLIHVFVHSTFAVPSSFMNSTGSSAVGAPPSNSFSNTSISFELNNELTSPMARITASSRLFGSLLSISLWMLWIASTFSISAEWMRWYILTRASRPLSPGARSASWIWSSKVKEDLDRVFFLGRGSLGDAGLEDCRLSLVRGFFSGGPVFLLAIKLWNRDQQVTEAAITEGNWKSLE